MQRLTKFGIQRILLLPLTFENTDDRLILLFRRSTEENFKKLLDIDKTLTAWLLDVKLKYNLASTVSILRVSRGTMTLIFKNL